jgi:hypothetical protein
MVDSRIVLGCIVRDKVTKFEGVVVSTTTWLNKCVRVELQPQKLGKDGKIQATGHFDIEQVDYRGKGITRSPLRDGSSKIVLGVLAKDTLTQFTGIVMYRAKYFDGQVRVGLQPRDLKDEKPIDLAGFDIQMVTYAGQGVAEFKQKETGGPMPSARRVESKR